MISSLSQGVLIVVFSLLSWQNGNAEEYPSYEEFVEAINTNTWYLTNVDSSSWHQTNGKLIYVNPEMNGDSDALIFIRKSVPLTQSWELSFDLHQGTNRVTNSPNTNWAFKKAGFIFANIGPLSNNFYGYLGAAFYDNGTNHPELEYKLMSSTNENWSNQITHESFVTAFQSPWRSSNSWYPQTSTITATWSSTNATLKLKLSEKGEVSSPDPRSGKIEVELINPFRYKSNSLSLTNLSIGIILKSANQPIQASDIFALDSVSFRMATNPILASDNDDADGDRISNYDEIVVLQTDPNDYNPTSPVNGLYTFDFVSNHPTFFGLLDPDEIFDEVLSFGGLILTKNTNSNSFTLNYNILMSTNLSMWRTNATRSYEITNAPTNKMFLRIEPVLIMPSLPPPVVTTPSPPPATPH